MDDTKASKWPVHDESGTHVGDVIRQRGTTLWSLQRRGMDRPFKRNIHTLDAAKKLAAEYPRFGPVRTSICARARYTRQFGLRCLRECLAF